MTEKETLQLFIEHEQQGEYITLPFILPPDIESISLHYQYKRHQHTPEQHENGQFNKRIEINIIDLGLVSPEGTQVGASGSDKQEINLSTTRATDGYRPHPMTPGQWKILVGAYKIAPEGVTVTYELEFSPKHQQLLLGDLHTHTLASDGVLTAEELAVHARRHNLDFLAITDHNQMISANALPKIEGITLIPGVEWSHYQGHANFLGVDQPYESPYFTNNLAETQAIFNSARQRGALITLNHPFEETCPLSYALETLPFDALEVWNGPMRESNIRSIALWQSLLAAGKKIPICGGSDYHRDRLFQILGGPTMGVYTNSNSTAGILSAVRQGHSFITFSPEGPKLRLSCGQAFMGDSITWEAGQKLQIELDGLEKDDLVSVISADEIIDLIKAPASGSFKTTFPITAPGFYRVEVWRTFLPGVPPLPALLSNPLYFCK